MDPKLLLVLSPLALAGLVVAWAAWRGRLPSRPLLNVLFSLLLLVYLLATAGLGIFWVAYQHLPVFDWHYLFGYALVLLVLVHLGFNARVVWHQLRRRGTARAVPPAGTDKPRRGWVAAALFGAPALLALGYGVGLRHGRTELRVVAAGGGSASAGTAGTAGTASGSTAALVEAFHEYSSHSRRGTLRHAASVDWGGAPAPFKSYPGRATLPAPAPLDRLLWHVTGVTLQRGGIHFRASPSSGALFATELYLWARGEASLPRGWWHCDAHGGRLASLGTRDGGLAMLGAMAAAPVLIVATAIFRRSGHKYGDRTYRYVLADLGHALENLRQAAVALGWQAVLLPTFDEAALAGDLALNEAEEGVLAVAALGPAGTLPAVPDGLARGGPASLVSGRALGVTDAMHQASSWRAAAAPLASPPVGPLASTPAASALRGDVLALIARRRSLRRYGSTPLSADRLGALQRVSTSTPPLLSAAVRVHVVAHAVQGLPSAAHDIRARSRAAALDQDVVGDAAALFVLTLHRPTLAADSLGAARAYRHAFIQAGLIGERLYLEATALGLGVCGVGAFYDDEAAALIGVDVAREWVLHIVAVGVPA